MSKGGVAAVDRALSILGAFGPEGRPMTLNDIAGATGMYKSTILRLIASLERYNCMLRLQDGSYQLGPSLFHWGSLYLNSLRLEDHTLPLLRRLVEQTGESASFYTRQGNQRLCLLRVDSPKSVRDHVRVGDLLPLSQGAAGRILGEFDGAAARGRAAEVATSLGERDAETAAVAAPVFGLAQDLLGALSVSGPLVRFTPEAVAQVSAAVLDAARQLTARMGGDASRFELAAPPAVPQKRSSSKPAPPAHSRGAAQRGGRR